VQLTQELHAKGQLLGSFAIELDFNCNQCQGARWQTIGDGLAAGAMSVQEPIKKDDEDKRGGVKDAGGTTWWLATKVK
jgi:hypothetical protein